MCASSKNVSNRRKTSSRTCWKLGHFCENENTAADGQETPREVRRELSKDSTENHSTYLFPQKNSIGFFWKHYHVAFRPTGNRRCTYDGQELQERHVVILLLLRHVLRLVTRRGVLILRVGCLSPAPEGAPWRFGVYGVLLLLGPPFLRDLYVSVVGLEKKEFVSIKSTSKREVHSKCRNSARIT